MKKLRREAHIGNFSTEANHQQQQHHYLLVFLLLPLQQNMNFEKLVIIAEGHFLCALFLFLCRSNSLPNAHTHSTATVYHLVLLLAFVIEIGKGDVSSLPLSSGDMLRTIFSPFLLSFPRIS
jgi:hypothetical protein